MGKKKKPHKVSPSVIRVPLNYEFPVDCGLEKFANHMLVQKDRHEFHLSFFQMQPPIILGDTSEERKNQAENVKSVTATCVARIVIAEGRMEEVVRALTAVLDASLGDDDDHNEKNGHESDG